MCLHLSRQYYDAPHPSKTPSCFDPEGSDNPFRARIAASTDNSQIEHPHFALDEAISAAAAGAQCDTAAAVRAQVWKHLAINDYGMEQRFSKLMCDPYDLGNLTSESNMRRGMKLFNLWLRMYQLLLRA